MMLELRNLYKTYLQGKLEVPVLKNISLSVEEGEYVAIMGPSGSGKTTLMNIIGCLDNPTSGEYLLEGTDISQIGDSKMSEVRLHSIGFVFQSFYLLSRQSALDNVALPLLYAGVHRHERNEIAKRALERVGLGDRTEFKPTQLSGGQCQRVAIARAIVNNPKILLADEPTGALDTKSGEQIMEIFQKLNDEGVTIVMITHEPEIAAHARRTLHIRDGRLLDAQGNFLTAEEPEVQEEALPDDVIPVQEFLAAPLDTHRAEPAGPDETAPAPSKSVSIDSVVFPTLSSVDESGAASAAEDTSPVEASEQPEQALEGVMEEILPEFLPVEQAPIPETLAYEEDAAPAGEDFSGDSYLDAEISALLDGETAHWEEEAFADTVSSEESEPASELPAPPFPGEVLAEDGTEFDIGQVSYSIDTEEETPLDEALPEFPVEEIPVEEVFMDESPEDELSMEPLDSEFVPDPVSSVDEPGLEFSVEEIPVEEVFAEESSGEEFSTESLDSEFVPEPVSSMDEPELEFSLEEIPVEEVFAGGSPEEEIYSEETPEEEFPVDLYAPGEPEEPSAAEEIPVQLSFDVWGAEPEDESEVPAGEAESLPEEPEGSFYVFPEADSIDEQATFGEDFFQPEEDLSSDAVPMEPEWLPGVPQQESGEASEDQGQFGIPIHTELDPAFLPFQKKQPKEAAGGFQEPIRIELDDLGLNDRADSPEASADKGDET